MHSRGIHPISSGRSGRRGTSAGFTLVELLTVMGIIGVLIAATLPAVRGLTGSNGRRGAVTGLLGAFDQARALAISEGRATYVVFLTPKPNLNGAAGQATPEPRRCGTSYAIFQDADNVSFLPVQRSNWLFLPTGIAYKINDGGGATSTLLNRSLTPGTDPAFPVPSGDPNGKAFPVQSICQPYARFDSTGASDVPPELARVLIFEGSVSADGKELPTKRAAGGADPETQRFVWEEIRLNYATGRARYTVDPRDIAFAAASPSPSPTP